MFFFFICFVYLIHVDSRYDALHLVTIFMLYFIYSFKQPFRLLPFFFDGGIFSHKLQSIFEFFSDLFHQCDCDKSKIYKFKNEKKRSFVSRNKIYLWNRSSHNLFVFLFGDMFLIVMRLEY